MSTLLITGATGNVGMEVLKALSQHKHPHSVIAGARKPQESTQLAPLCHHIRPFDFTDSGTYGTALQGVDVLFLLRPPHISEVKTYFAPLVQEAKKAGVKHIVFLSVQGAATSSFIPHHKIEKLIETSRIPYTFLRPAYFMQNFTTTLLDDIRLRRQLYVPAGNAPFSLIDVIDIGKVAARVLANPELYRNNAYDLTNNELLTFEQMADKLSKVTSTPIRYRSPNLLAFFVAKRRQKLPVMLILVMIMLHYLPRFKSAPPRSAWVEKITGEPPRTFNDFLQDNMACFSSLQTASEN
ncbi:NmrA family NAD(P)-binding protein [Cesiribacter andamanensis]|uniref:NAD(P)H azoreductase n=1 Tax=Cesiribacter andamanensis AMV16 TaxID=1279009 RepID=M7NN13_9BACT|nr:NmrA family NAD(P)-binding protein [Cesiribacter andamanensis]EMR03135.1 NAD(P)H azoreductase [Cesiribacter andamanensis AMV16]